MESSGLTEIGYVIKTHGVKGHIKISFAENIRKLKAPEALFFLIRGNYLPYFIRSVEYINESQAIVLLEDIGMKEAAAALAHKAVFTTDKSVLRENAFEEDINDSYINYAVTDETAGELGKVVHVYEMQEYELIEVEYKNKSILIPLHDESVLLIDDENRLLKLRKPPDGLLELYMNE